MLARGDVGLKEIINLYPRMRGDVVGTSLDDIISKVFMLASLGPSYSVSCGDKVLGIGGVYTITPGVGQIWIIGSDSITEHGREFTKEIKLIRDDIIKNHNFHRLQSEVLANKKSWIKWANMLGFKSEGLMRNYTSDKRDCILVAYIGE